MLDALASDALEEISIRVQFSRKGLIMKKEQKKRVEQPKPFTPGLTKTMVREHAFRLFRDKLANRSLTLQDWVLAEKDLVNEMETEGVES
jgi:hypothetical protein